MIYDPALFRDATANRWVRYLQDLTRGAIANIDSPLRELKLERSGAEAFEHGKSMHTETEAAVTRRSSRRRQANSRVAR